MNQTARFLAVVLVVCVGLLPIGDIAAASPPEPSAVKEQLGQYGVGANLKIKLEDGGKAKGFLVSIGEEGFELRGKSSETPHLIAYNSVSEVRHAKLVYRAKGAPDAVEARRVVLGLGVGHHIQVRTTAGGKEIHGNIQTIAADTFTMLPDRETAPVTIVFSDVRYVEQNMSTAAKVAIGVGITAAAILIPLFVVLSRD